MIACALEPLLPEADKDLRKLFNSTGFSTLQRVLEAQVKHHQARALKDAVQSGEGNHLLQASNNGLREAQRYQAAIDILRTLSQQTEPYKIAKLT